MSKPDEGSIASSTLPDPLVPAAGSLSSLTARTRAVLAATWLISAIAPALAVYLAMRQPRNAAAELRPVGTTQYEATATTEPPPTKPTTTDAQPAASPPVPVVEASPSSASSSGIEPAAAIASAADGRPAASAPAVVLTESGDRVAVLVSSRPKGARIFRRGKEVGRTPVTLEIGRGENRIFEIGAPGYTTRRITVNGEKPELMVNLALQPKAETVKAPTP